MGNLNADSNIPSGAYGGLPLGLYSPKKDFAAVIIPAKQFMISSNDHLSFGIMGSIEKLIEKTEI